MSEANKAAVNRFVVEYQCKRDESVCLELTADDFVDHTPWVAGQNDKYSVIDGHRPLFDAFPDLWVHVVQQFSEGDHVITHKRLTGTHRGEFDGVPATGRTIDFEYADIVRVKDGQIVEHWMFFDQLGLMAQLTD